MQDNKTLWVVITTILVAVFAYSLFFNSPTYTVTFDSDGGTTISEQAIRRNRFAEVLENPVREGYQFVGWMVNDELVELSEKAITGNTTFKALWEAKTYTITFDSGRGTEVEPIEVNHGEAASRPTNPTRDNRRFHYWSYEGERFNWDTPIYQDKELVAVWRR